MYHRGLIFEQINKHVKVSISARSLITYSMNCLFLYILSDWAEEEELLEYLGSISIICV